MAQATHFSVHDETSLLLLKASDAIEDLQKRKHGKWERNYDGIFYWWECSECHHDAWYDKEDLTNFCPNCGADMRGEHDE